MLCVSKPERRKSGTPGRHARPEGRPERAKQRANGARLRATSTDSRRQSPQVNGPLGHVQRRRNTQKNMVCIQKARGSSPLSSTHFSNTCPRVQQRRTATGTYSASSGSAASAEPEARPDRRAARGVALHAVPAVAGTPHAAQLESGEGGHRERHNAVLHHRVVLDRVDGVGVYRRDHCSHLLRAIGKEIGQVIIEANLPPPAVPLLTGRTMYCLW